MAEPYEHDPELRRRLIERLAARHPGSSRGPRGGDTHAGAAVALTVVPGDRGRAELLVILRAASLRRHAGQYGLPGGRIEAGESVAVAARRELAEELGIHVRPEGLLGALPAVASRSGFRIAPVVLWVEEPVDPVPDPVEIQDWYRLPLAELAAARVHRLGGGLPILGTVVFAPTGQILRSFRDLLVADPEAERPEGPLSEPPFTWR